VWRKNFFGGNVPRRGNITVFGGREKKGKKWIIGGTTEKGRSSAHPFSKKGKKGMSRNHHKEGPALPALSPKLKERKAVYGRGKGRISSNTPTRRRKKKKRTSLPRIQTHGKEGK